MPTLIIEQTGSRTGGRIPGRVLIGRLPTNGIALADSSISRLHAWIDRNPDGSFYVADTGSLTGTRVNGRPIENWIRETARTVSASSAGAQRYLALQRMTATVSGE